MYSVYQRDFPALLLLQELSSLFIGLINILNLTSQNSPDTNHHGNMPN